MNTDSDGEREPMVVRKWQGTVALHDAEPMARTPSVAAAFGVRLSFAALIGRGFRSLVFLVTGVALFAQMPTEIPPYRQPALPIQQRVEDLLSRMTLEEKVHQLHQGSVGDTNPNNISARAGDFRPTYGSYIVGGPAVLEIRNVIQRRALEESRLGIPVIFGADVIHGWRAITPIPLAQACSWNPDLVRRGAAMAAAEARAQGVDWTFAPMVDHCVDPRWGRIAETFGESPYASGVFAVASVRGHQGERLGAPGTVASCLKHYVGYGASEGGRDYSFTEIAPQSLWERHLPSFEAGVRAGARTVMSAFNDLNGVPTSANRFTLTDVLRERWGFDGLVVSDWNSVLQLMHQGFAADEAEAVQRAITAGVDLDMADGLYVKHLPTLVEAGEIPMAVVDEAVRRVLRVKFELGLFEQPLAERSALTEAPPNAEQLALAEEIAAQSMVLLKNDGVLPLVKAERSRGGGSKQDHGRDAHPTPETMGGTPLLRYPRIALIGPLARHAHALLGSWAQQGRPDETPTIHDALHERLPAGVSLRFEPGCSIEGESTDGFPAAIALARESDVVLLCLGEEAWMSGENASRSTLRLAGRQEELALAVAAASKPVVLVIVSGRPVELHAIADRMNAIVAAWQGGSRAGAALAELLLGRKNFSGKLAVTWPRTTGQIPLFHHMRPRARLGDEGAYRDITTTALFEFGHGLSYTTFDYSEIRLDREHVRPGQRIVAEITVTNRGDRAGDETLLWFIRDPAASITRPLKELKHFEKASIAPGESRVFRAEIEPRRDLVFPDAAGRPVLESGEILVFAGPKTERFYVDAR